LKLFGNVDDILMSFGVSIEDVGETINWIVAERGRLSKGFLLAGGLQRRAFGWF